jgi:hypothetical protein
MPALVTLLAAPGARAQATPEAVDPAQCEVTLPTGPYPGETAVEYWQPAIPFEDTWYGEGELYARVTPDGVVEAQLDPDRGGGWFATMWVQDARPDGMYPALEFAVARVGEAASTEPPPEVRTPAFAVIGQVQTAGIWVAEGGCWEITATATDMVTSDRKALTITVWVTIPALEPILM